MKQQDARTANTFHRESEIMIFICIMLSLLYADPLGFLQYSYSIYMSTACLFSSVVCNPLPTLFFDPRGETKTKKDIAIGRGYI